MRFTSSTFLAIACLIAAFALMALAGLLKVREIYVPVFLLLIAAAFFGYRAFSGTLPTAEDTERFLIGLLASKGFGGAFCVSDVSSRAARGAAAGKAIVRFSAQVSMTEPLYKTALLDETQCAGFTPRRVSALLAAAQRLRGELGEAAGALAARPPEDPFDRRYLTAAAKQGLSVAFSGVAGASHNAGQWKLRVEELSGEFGGLVRTGLPRAAFPDAIVLDSSDGRQWVRDTMKAWVDFSAEVGELQKLADRLAAERAAAAVAAFFTVVRAGAFFSGPGASAAGQGAGTPFFLEWTSLEPAEKRAAFLLRNDGAWRLRRPFAGTVAGDPATGSALLRARTSAADAIPGAGPLLGVAAEFELEVRWRPDAPGLLAVAAGDFSAALLELAPAGLEAARAAAFPFERLLEQRLAPGARHSGRATGEGFDAALRLEFVEGPEPGRPLARVSCREAGGLFTVEIVSNRHAEAPRDLVLAPTAGFAPGADAEAWTSLALTLTAAGFEGVVETASGRLAVVVYS